MQILRTDGARARLRLGRESLRRLDRAELEQVRGGDAVREGGDAESGLVVGSASQIDQRSVIGCPLPLP